MTELMNAERDYLPKLNDDERKLYLADNQQLAKLRGLNTYNVNTFVDIASLLNQLHNDHQRYNDLYTKYVEPNPQKATDIDILLDNVFNFKIAIGSYAAVISLYNMDQCQALYEFLASLKITQFDVLLDEHDAKELLACIG